MATDLARGRRALRRRRTLTGAAGGVFAVAAVGAVISYGAATPPGEYAAPAPSVTSSVVRTELVAYRGKQPEGFVIDKIPSGWEIYRSSATALTIAPLGTFAKDPELWAGKNTVMLQALADAEPSGTRVQVGGRPGILTRMDAEGDAKALLVRQPSGMYLTIQIRDARGWSDDDIVAFGAGIHVVPPSGRGGE
ncbi:hypothetical protein [Actinoplanes sp. RD1]|uniref:hypothetical protein n=1 Tax=Actinoplanes sp. RD1 TaxID=3064538 RepID=UPI00274282EE|nr:hypothetical protein [Actinoplanes sp. RD1]